MWLLNKADKNFFIKIYNKILVLFVITCFLGPGILKSSEKPTQEQSASSSDEQSGLQNEDWLKVQKDYQAALIKFENDKKALSELQASFSNSSSENSNLSQMQRQSLIDAEKSLKESAKNFSRLQKQYDLKFPEKGLNQRRKYSRENQTHTSDQIENDASLRYVDKKSHNTKLTIEQKMKDLGQTIEKQYSVDEKKLELKTNPQKPKIKDSKLPLDEDSIIRKTKLER